MFAFGCFGTIHRHYSPARRAVGCAMLFGLEPCMFVNLIPCIYICCLYMMCMMKQLKNPKCFGWELIIVNGECICDLCVCV